VRRGKLLPRDTYQKLLKMDIPEITRFIEGTEYGREINELATKFRGIDLLENALNVNEERNYAEVKKFVSGEVGDLVRHYLERYHYWNMKTLLRARYFGASPQDLTRELLMETREDFDFYNELINAEGQGLKPVIDALAAHPKGAAIAKILNEGRGATGPETAQLQTYEDALDRAYYRGLLDTIQADSTENRLFLQFIRREIDVRNLQILLRLKSRGETAENLADMLLPGGQEFKPNDLRRLAEAPDLDELVERLKEFKIHEKIKDEIAQAQQTKTLTPVMIGLTRLLADYAEEFGHLNPLSVLPIINYLMRKNLEVRNLRAIARGKQSGLGEDEIERLLVII
jgi:V/A-type H+-transporting ATPase subunit C